MTFSSAPQASEQPPSPLWSWSSQQVCDWLQGLHMDQYVPQFKAQQVDGQQLLHLDGAKLKVRTDRQTKRQTISWASCASSRSHDFLPAYLAPVLCSVWCRPQGLGVLRSSDRSALKRRIKEVQSAAEKERKALDKKEKQRQRRN